MRPMSIPYHFVRNLIESLSLKRGVRRAPSSRYNRAMDTGTRKNILVADDDPVIARLVAETLRSDDMDIAVAYAGDDAWALFQERPFDLLVLDIMMPGMDGLELCSRVRAVSRVPIIFLSAKDEESDKVAGLMTGADDYVVKPFMPRELVARVRSCLRRASYAQEGRPVAGMLICRGIELDPSAHTASLHGTRLSLTPKEFDMLALLLRAQGRPVATRKLYEAVWGEEYYPGNANSVMVHVRHLRTKLASIDSDQVFIETVWGVGYKIAP